MHLFVKEVPGVLPRKIFEYLECRRIKPSDTILQINYYIRQFLYDSKESVTNFVQLELNTALYLKQSFSA